MIFEPLVFIQRTPTSPLSLGARQFRFPDAKKVPLSEMEPFHYLDLKCSFNDPESPENQWFHLR